MMRQKRKRWAVWLFAVCLLVAGAFPAWAAGKGQNAGGSGAPAERVFDMADLFTEEEVLKLAQQIQDVRAQMNMDLVLVTTDDAQGMSSEQYADWYYENGGFGVGADYRGALLLLDMDNRMIYVSTEGAMIRFLTDSRIETMMDHAITAMKQGEYAAAAESMISDVETFYEKGIPQGQYNYDRDTGAVSVYRSIRWYEALLAFGVAVISAVGACGAVKRQYAMKEEQQHAANYHMAYRAKAQFHYRNQDDVFIRDFLTPKVVISASPTVRTGGRSSGGGRSTTHHSGGGRSHGGGGRGF